MICSVVTNTVRCGSVPHVAAPAIAQLVALRTSSTPPRASVTSVCVRTSTTRDGHDHDHQPDVCDVSRRTAGGSGPPAPNAGPRDAPPYARSVRADAAHHLRRSVANTNAASPNAEERRHVAARRSRTSPDDRQRARPRPATFIRCSWYRAEPGATAGAARSPSGTAAAGTPARRSGRSTAPPTRRPVVPVRASMSSGKIVPISTVSVRRQQQQVVPQERAPPATGAGRYRPSERSRHDRTAISPKPATQHQQQEAQVHRPDRATGRTRAREDRIEPRVRNVPNVVSANVADAPARGSRPSACPGAPGSSPSAGTRSPPATAAGRRSRPGPRPSSRPTRARRRTTARRGTARRVRKSHAVSVHRRVMRIHRSDRRPGERAPPCRTRTAPSSR